MASLVLLSLLVGQSSTPPPPIVLQKFSHALSLVGKPNTSVVEALGTPGAAAGTKFSYYYRGNTHTDTLVVNFDNQNFVSRVSMDIKSVEPTLAEMSKWLGVKPAWVSVQHYYVNEASLKGSSSSTQFYVNALLPVGDRIEFGLFVADRSPIVGEKRLNLQTNKFEVTNYRFDPEAGIFRARPKYRNLRVSAPLAGEPQSTTHRAVKIN